MCQYKGINKTTETTNTIQKNNMKLKSQSEQTHAKMDCGKDRETNPTN